MDNNNRPLLAHLSILSACIFWGLMSPLGKDAMTHGIDGIDMVSMRVVGGAALFWLTSLFIKGEKVAVRDRFMFCLAGIFGLVFNQCCFTIGLNITSPINASIVTTSMPIFAMLLAAVILREPITGKKAIGVATGCCGAVILILTSATSGGDSKVGDIRGDLLCMGAQLSYALYLSLFNKLVKRYNAITVNKWMFLWATVLIIPFASPHLAATDWAAVPVKTWLETGFVVFFGTYISYLLMMVALSTLRPTVVSIYNYMQPVTAVAVSLLAGIAVFKWSQGVAIALVFAGVALVTKSKSRRDIEQKPSENLAEDTTGKAN